MNTEFFPVEKGFNKHLEAALRHHGVSQIAKELEFDEAKKVTINFVSLTGSTAHCIFTMASCRERYLLADRKAILMQQNPQCCYRLSTLLRSTVNAVTYWFVGRHEDTDNTPEECIAEYRKRAPHFVAIPESHVLSVFDPERTANFLSAIS